jgi:DNA modification methylase
MNLPISKERDGYIGIADFRGDLIRIFQDAGFIYHSEVCIWKDPVTAMQRTKALGLLHKQIKKDSCMSRQGIADYLVTMRKPGENPERVTHTNESLPVSVWQRYASPVWMDIDPSDTLQRKSAREEEDERHICPLQLEVIRRAIELWSNAGDVVFSPFAGIGSEGYVAIQQGRKFAGIELKESYFKQSVENLRTAHRMTNPLFAEVESV